MIDSIRQSSNRSFKQSKVIAFDPRTKILLLLTVSTFVLGGLGNGNLPFLLPILCVIPFVLLFISGKRKQAILYTLIFASAYAMSIFLLPKLSGLLGYLMLASTGILSRVMPGVVMGMFVISSTTVSEFTAAMQKIHVSEKIIIPLSVMFRFFPTIAEEFASINAAMRMRGIRFGGGRIDKMIEYRLVPLISCAAKIGEELSAAALARGLGGEISRTNLCEIGFKAQDIFVVTFCAAAFIATALAYIGVL